MAETASKNSRKKPTIKKQQTVRQRTQTSGEPKRRRVRQTAGKIAGPIGNLASFIGRKLRFLRLPNNRFGRILGSILFPNFIRNSWRELRQVTWPNARDTFRLTMAVFIFSVIFAAIVGVLDYGLDKLFKEVVIGK